nr:CBO0543 family protein [uncultured Bacillus sp.]
MKFKAEKIIESSVLGVMILLLLKFVPKTRIREAVAVFFFKQCITWLFGLLVVEKRLIRYPARLFFKKATKSSFTFEYFVYPSLCVLFNLYYPEHRSKLIKTLYFFGHSLLITGFEVFALKWTRLITYTGWKWYWTLTTILGTYYLSYRFHGWFFKSGVSEVMEGKSDARS